MRSTTASARPARQFVFLQAQRGPQAAEHRPGALQTGADAGLGVRPPEVGQGLGGLPQQAQLDARARPGQTEVALRGEPLATAVEVQMGQGEGIGRVLAALAFQDPEQQRRQILRAGLARQGPQLAAHLAARDLVAQQGVVAIEQLVTDGGEKVEMAQQIGDASLAAGGDRLGTRRTQVAHHRQRVAEGIQGALDGGAQFAGVFRCDAHRVEHPAGPAGQAQERAALAPVAGGVDVQGIAMGHGGAQGRGALPMPGLQCSQEAVAERGDGAGGEQEALAGQLGADFLALEVVQVAGQPDAHDQVVAVALAGRDQASQLPGDGDRAGLAGAAMLADLAGH